MDSGDRLCDNVIYTYLDGIRKYKNVDLIYGHQRFINENNEKIKTVIHIPYKYHLTTLRLYLPPSTGALFRANLLKTCNLSTDYHYIMDVVWFLMYGNRVRTKLLNSVLSEFRVSSENKTSSLILQNKVSDLHRIERQLSSKFFPKYARNEENTLYVILRQCGKIEYYIKKVSLYVSFYFITRI